MITDTTCSSTYLPKYEDAFSMRYGLFIHWVGPCNGRPGGICKVDGTSIITDIDSYADTYNISRIVKDISDLGFEYVVVTDFHGKGTLLHPSDVSKKYRGAEYATTERDVMGEFIQGLYEAGIGSILFTHPLDGHDYHDRESLGWNDPSNGYGKWNDFVNDMHEELVHKYGKYIMGIGCDSEFGLSNNEEWKDKLDLPRLRQTIHEASGEKRLQLYAIAGPNDTCEFGFKEVWRPSWLDPWKGLADDNYDTDKWTSYKRVVAVAQANHWATIGPASKGKANCNARQVYRYSVLQAAVATEGPGVAWAVSPYSTGEWEANVQEVFVQVEDWTKDVRKSLRRVYPSTSYVTTEGSQIATLSHGIVATKSMDDLEEYIHVLNPPTSIHDEDDNTCDITKNTKVLRLPLPQDGKIFTSARLLRTGEEVILKTADDDNDKGEIVLELTEDQEWEEHNTIIVLTVDPASIIPSFQKNIALHKPVIYSSSEESIRLFKSNFGSLQLTDGNIGVVKLVSADGRTQGNYGWKSKHRFHPAEYFYPTNLALNKPAYQSSTLSSFDNNNNWDATNVVSGNRRTNSGCTQNTTKNWWQVDLRVIASIKKIVVYNRFDDDDDNSCWKGLNGVVVTILDSDREATWKSSPVAIQQDDNAAKTLIFDDFPSTTLGSYIRITQNSNNNYLCLGEVEVYGPVVKEFDDSNEQSLPNLALMKPTFQSTTLPSKKDLWASDNAVSGKDNKLSTHTTKTSGNWWQVNLEVVALIQSIRIYNRYDGPWERLKGTVVTIRNSDNEVVWKSEEVTEEGEVVVFDNIPENTEGSYVRIIQKSNILSLGEVEVYGNIIDYDLEDESKKQNLALHKPTYQSSTLPSNNEQWESSNAVRTFQKSSCTRRNEGNASNWWQVNLEVVATIQKIILTNSYDTPWNQLKGTYVIILNSNNKVVWTSPRIKKEDADQEHLVFDSIPENTVGSYVRLVQNMNFLTLGEVKVYGIVHDICVPKPMTNLALNKPAYQSSTLSSDDDNDHNWEASNAVSGKHKRKSTCTETDRKNWWQVVFSKVDATIHKIVLYNRYEGPYDRLKGAVVTIRNSNNKLVWESEAIQEDDAKQLVFEDFPNDVVAGCNVRIMQSKNYLSLGEVEVYGTIPILEEEDAKELPKIINYPWVGIDLEEPTIITKIVLYPQNDHNHEGCGFPIHYTIEGALQNPNSDTSSWFVLTEKKEEDTADTPRIIEIKPPQLVRYVRVVGNQLRQQDDQMQLVEMQIFKEEADTTTVCEATNEE
eukprot:CAMPEP_0194172114 /NCGR_PEP_ID=MMETSP0154-20130528/6597_1 /TAXON_ID=1049557 /ORGANISM="Thalassiothrix antarctica, Strain L6-D1" /LENGTH=1266 /DNA_ID=CAMNT_0038884651 /DNA_START=80 /DNA_END=3880 /DNA_ORIENTATION=-